jgi:hypothetical protein
METLSSITAVGCSIIGALCTPVSKRRRLMVVVLFIPSQKRLSKKTIRFLAAGKETTQRRKIS